MNERIKELADKADIVDWSSEPDLWIEYFAELIARECADYAHNEYDILKHFGVKP
jgi:hypothetical protein